MLHDPPLLLLDEPRAGLDPAAAELLEPLIGRRSGRTRVLVTHDVEGALAEADVALGLRGGRQAFAGAAAPARRGSSTVIRAARAILRKDLRLELRTKESVPAMALFTVTAFVLFHFGLDRDTLDGELASGVLWVTLLLAAVIGVTRLFAAEREQGGIDGLLLAPVDRTSLFLAKAARCFSSSWRSSWWPCRRSACCCSAPAWAARCPSWWPILLLADLGLAAVGALTAALASETPRARADRAAAAAAAAGAAADRRRRRPASRCCA